VSFPLSLTLLIRRQILLCGCFHHTCPCDVKRLLAGSSVWYRAGDVPDSMWFPFLRRASPPCRTRRRRNQHGHWTAGVPTRALRLSAKRQADRLTCSVLSGRILRRRDRSGRWTAGSPVKAPLHRRLRLPLRAPRRRLWRRAPPALRPAAAQKALPGRRRAGSGKLESAAAATCRRTSSASCCSR